MKKVILLSAMFLALIGCEQQSAEAPAEQPAATAPAAPAQEGQAPAEAPAPAAPANEAK
jgi:hypothetical protein